jgi:hypothetical protein
MSSRVDVSRYRQFREQGVVFVFKTDADDPELLHIYARHLTTVDDALDVFFDPGARETWNPQHQRFERYNGTHGLFWFWRDEAKKVVMVITCFTLEGGQS